MRRTRPYLVQSWMDRGIPTGWIDVLSATLDPAGFLPSFRADCECLGWVVHYLPIFFIHRRLALPYVFEPDD
jgi:hypothetical protein